MAHHRPSVRRRVRSESGSIIILTALSMVLFMGILAFAVDTSFLYTERNRMAAAADAGAKAGAIEYHRKSTASNADLLAFAKHQVQAHGFDPTGPTNVVLNRPPASGPFSGNANYVEVLVSQSTPTFFARAFNAAFASVTPMARAVAGTSNPQNCLITNQDLSIGNSTLTMNGCDVGVGGNLHGTNPNAVINGSPAPGVSVTGSCSGTCGAMGTLQTGQPKPVDPMAGLAAPVVGAICVAAPVANPLPPGCYTSIPNSITQLQAGTFKVTGTMDVGNLTGSGVLIYLTSTGSIMGGNNGSLTLTAGTAAPYAGIAIYGDAGSVLDAKNNFTLSITGAIYMPGSDIDFKNALNITNTGCSLFIFNSLQIKNGNGAVSTTSCGSIFGNAAFLGVSLGE